MITVIFGLIAYFISLNSLALFKFFIVIKDKFISQNYIKFIIRIVFLFWNFIVPLVFCGHDYSIVYAFRGISGISAFFVVPQVPQQRPVKAVGLCYP